MRTSSLRLLAIAALLAVAGCGRPGPDLARLYHVGAGPGDTTPVIVIPGLFGSKLRNRTTGAEVWPGSAQMILFDDYHSLGLDFDRASLQVRPDTNEAFGI